MALVTDSRTDSTRNLSSLLVALGLLVACGDSGMAPPPVPASVTVSPASLTFNALGDTTRLTATVRDLGGQPVAGAAVTWESSDPAVATVSASGLVTSAANGAATVTATAGSATGSAGVDVEQVPSSVLLSSPLDSLTVGDSIQLSAEALDAGGSQVPGTEFVWASSDPAVAVVNQEGWVRARIPGSVEITASLGDLSATSSLVSLPLPEPDVLAAFYETTNGALWKDHTNWLTDAPLEEWYGVHLDDGGRVAHLLLTDNGLIGSITPHITSLERLESLHLGLNDLTGPFPSEIANLGRLKSLELTYNTLSGPIPPEIGRMTSLEWLGLFGNTLSGPIPPEIGNLSSLTFLDLCYNRLTGPIPPEIGNLVNLESLALCGIDSNPEGGNRLTDEIPPEIGKLTKLTSLNLGANLLSGPIPPEIGNLTSLDTLLLYSNGLTELPPEVGALASLEVLTLYGNRLTGSIPPELGNLRSLRKLNFGLGLTSGANLLRGPIPPELGKLVHLTRLDLGGNDLTGSIPPELGRLSALEELELGSNGLTGPIPAEFGDLTSLTRLSLCHNALEGVVPPDLGGLPKLRQLYLCRNGLGGPIPPEFGGLADLRHLNVAVNRLTGKMPGSMVSLKRLLTFNWGNNDGLCAPLTDAFVAWLSGISTARGDRCSAGAMAGGVAAAATDVVRCSVAVVGGRGGSPAGTRRDPVAIFRVAGESVKCDPVHLPVNRIRPN